MWTERTRPVVGSLSVAAGAVLWLLLAAVAQAQLPDKFRNLQVLPKDISKQDLTETMKGFTAALGVRCPFCHVGKEGEPLNTFDFASNEKPTKRTARTMIRMVRQINTEYLAKLPDRTTSSLQVRCETCHHGRNRPEPLQDVLSAELSRNGLEAAIQKYQALKAQYYGGYAFDFSERSLNGFAQQLAAGGKTAEAIGFLKINAEAYPKSPVIPFLLGEAYLKAGDKTAAAASYRKALEANPDNPIAKQRLSELEPTPPR